eukprot:356133-Chlamydomonas_euryale.AAC.29
MGKGEEGVTTTTTAAGQRPLAARVTAPTSAQGRPSQDMPSSEEDAEEEGWTSADAGSRRRRPMTAGHDDGPATGRLAGDQQQRGSLLLNMVPRVLARMAQQPTASLRFFELRIRE